MYKPQSSSQFKPRPLTVAATKKSVAPRQNTGSSTRLPNDIIYGNGEGSPRFYRTRLDFENMRLCLDEIVQSSVGWEHRRTWPWVYLRAATMEQAVAQCCLFNARIDAGMVGGINDLPRMWQVILITALAVDEESALRLPHGKSYFPKQPTIDCQFEEAEATDYYVGTLELLSRLLARDLLATDSSTIHEKHTAVVAVVREAPSSSVVGEEVSTRHSHR